MTDFKRTTRWSYSSVSTYKACPQKWRFSYIDNLPGDTSAAMSRGTRMHAMAEEYVLGKITFCPPEIKKVGPMLEMFKTLKAQPEEVWLLDKDWKHTDDLSQAWIKSIIDVTYRVDDVLFVKDYKSGRMYPDHAEQLELYGLMGMCKFPDVKRVEYAAIYLDTGHEGHEGSIIRAMTDKLRAKWDRDALVMMTDEVYEPRPGPACRWCSYKKENGGPCLY